MIRPQIRVGGAGARRLPFPPAPAMRKRIARFAVTGGVSALAQLLLLHGFLRLGWTPFGANALAFVLAAQVNFVLSTRFTWGDRRCSTSLVRRWLLFLGSASMGAAVNLIVFAAAESWLPVTVAALGGIVAGSVWNYLAGDLLVFRPASASWIEVDPSQRRRTAA